LVRKTDRALAGGGDFAYPTFGILLHAQVSGESAMVERVERSRLNVAVELADFIEKRALPGAGVDVAAFWEGFSKLLHEYAPKNRALLERRAALQAQIDDWHKARKGQAHDPDGYKAFLEEIGYLVPEGGDFPIETVEDRPRDRLGRGPAAGGADHQCALCAERRQCALGQPLRRAVRDGRDGLAAPPGGYDRAAGARVVARARVFLDDAFPIAGASHADIRRYRVEKGQLLIDDKPLMTPEKFVGYSGHPRGAGHGSCCATTGCMWNWCSTGPTPSAARDQALLADVRMEAAVSRDHGLRGFGRLRRCRGQGAGLWQLAGADAGATWPRASRRAARRSRAS
jgi:malate synthase